MSKEIEEYHIVSGESPNHLAKNVNVYISKGWRPLGGCIVEHSNGSEVNFWFQAMVKIVRFTRMASTGDSPNG